MLEATPDRITAVVRKPSGATGTLTTSANVSLSTDATPLVAAGLLHAMQSGSDLYLDGVVDRVALDNAQRASTLLASWFHSLRPAGVAAASLSVAESPPDDRRGVACFFSGGMDSFYSALTRDEITHLVFVHGFDIALTDDELAAKAGSAAREAAAAMGKVLIEVRTDLKDFAHDQGLIWGKHYHGAALGAVAQMLSPHIRKAIIPASYHVTGLHPWGSHPDLDPLWGSARVAVEHHGEDARRPQKAAVLAQHQVAMDHLRVCWLNPGGQYNCGRCEKCIRTMINLRIVGAGGRCKTLPDALTPRDLRKLRGGEGSALFAKENLAEMERRGIKDDAVERALRAALRWSPAYQVRDRIMGRAVTTLKPAVSKVRRLTASRR
ncbi:hypothetical protein [Microlunatus sp. Y2014]|uniref:hypothetical protein n=1 Tax=Microlunatus sp. Y2014 TaxID=3418488 RepID=UPI003DA79F77